MIFTIENASKSAKTGIYHVIDNMGYRDYAEKYLLGTTDKDSDDLSYEVSLYSIMDYLERANNYKIYHSLNDYLTNTTQLKKLKEYTGANTVLNWYLKNGYKPFSKRSKLLIKELED